VIFLDFGLVEDESKVKEERGILKGAFNNLSFSNQSQIISLREKCMVSSQ